jgi:branched-chain amino acid transport system ATP-binding protein
MAEQALLTIQDLFVSYGGIRALQGISLDVYKGEIVTLIGANGAGKSTLLRAISGIVPVESGTITYGDTNLKSVPAHRIVELGVAHVPEGRGIFANLTVLENLKLATWSRKDRGALGQDYDKVFKLFPRLDERKLQLAGTLSGGEQQMLAVGRALMTRGQMVLFDEPSMGLAPVLVREIMQTIKDINQTGTTILLVEQNARQALKIAHRGYVLETGTLTLAGNAKELMDDPKVKAAYLGG